MKIEYLKRELNLYRLTGSSSDDTLNKLVKDITEGKEGDYIYVKGRKIAYIKNNVGSFDVYFLDHIMLKFELSSVFEVSEVINYITLICFNIRLTDILLAQNIK